MNTENFIEKAKLKHKNKYDYSKTVYNGCKNKIIIICPEHGEFLQIPNNHLQGQGCPICSGKIKKTTEQFIKEAKEIHQNEYDYSLVKYKNAKTKVKIICKKCGNVFEQLPKNHCRKNNPQGCPICYGNIIKTTEQFVEKSEKIWGLNKYDYSLVNYVNNRTKVKIKCLKHNLIFEQTPKKHYLGEGCFLCVCKSKSEEIIDAFLKKHNIKFIREYAFKDCKYKKVLPFDFYLPDYNIVLEYQGIQHFKQQGRGHEKLEERKLKDQIKRNYCLKNSIKEIEINYFDNLEIKLNFLLKILKEEKIGQTNKSIQAINQLFKRTVSVDGNCS